MKVKEGKLVKPVVARSGWANKNLCEKFIRGAFEPILDRKGQLTRFAISQSGAIENIKVRAEKQSHVTSVIRNVGSVQGSADHLNRMGLRFSFPKPVALIEYLLSMVSGTDFTVLDFFAGSGTTAEAALRLNAKDGGTRRFIMVSSTEATVAEPKKNVCRDQCAPRVAAVGAELRSNTLDAGFTYLRSRKMNFEDISYDLTDEHVWTFIQTLHGLRLSPFDSKQPHQMAKQAGLTISYLGRVTDRGIQSLLKLPANVPLVVYSHVTGKLAEALSARDNVEIRLIPDELTKRFVA